LPNSFSTYGLAYSGMVVCVILLGAGGDQGAGAHIQVYVDATNMVDSANMTRVVQQAILEVNKNGYSTVPAGQGF